MKENYGGSGQSDRGGQGKGGYGGGSEGDCGDWYASHDHMPGKPKTLYVTGKCKFPQPGYSVELKPAIPPGKNPAIYLLKKIVRKPLDPAADAITTVEVRYEEQTDNEYDEVQILPDLVTIKVEHPQ